MNNHIAYIFWVRVHPFAQQLAYFLERRVAADLYRYLKRSSV